MSMKRSSAYPERRSSGEIRMKCQQTYNQIVRDKQPSKINPVFLEDHYGIKKGAVKHE